MNLKDFIRETLTQIVDGIIEADKAVAEHGGAVNPRGVIVSKSGEGPYGYQKNERPDDMLRAVEIIEFDVVILAEAGSEAKSGIGIHVGAIGIGKVDKSGKTNTSESRIRFRVPLLLPNSNHLKTKP